MFALSVGSKADLDSRVNVFTCEGYGRMLNSEEGDTNHVIVYLIGLRTKFST